jgi:hypothetical protein
MSVPSVWPADRIDERDKPMAAILALLNTTLGLMARLPRLPRWWIPLGG